MIKNPIVVVNDFSGGQDTKTPIVSMALSKSPNMRNFHCAGNPNRLIKRGGFSKINSSATGSDDLDCYYPPGYQTHDYAVRDAAARTQISQGFKPGTSAAVQKVRLWLKKTSTPTGNINIEIQTDSSGKPSGTAVTNGTSANIDISTLTTSYDWYTFTFTTSPSLTSGTQYHIVLQGDNTINGTAYANWGADDYDLVFADGSMSDYDGTTWAANERYDAIFEVYITGGAKGNDCFALWDFSSKNMMIGVFGTTLYKMDKSSVGTPDGTWDNLYNVSAEVDYMEYSTDALAQAAYVSSSFGNQSNGDIDDEDMADISDWTEVKAGTGASSQATFDSESCMKLETGAAGGGTYVQRRQDIGSYTDPTIVSFRLYLDNVGEYSNSDSFYASFDGGGGQYRCICQFGTDGLFIYDGASYNEVGTNIVVQDAWQEWTFDIDETNGTVDVYLDGDLVQANVDCSLGGNTDGRTIFEIDGTTAANMVAYVDWFKAGSAITTQKIRSYSESTIKTQGTYSLKGIAELTDGLNSTLTNTLGTAIDLSNENTLKFDIRSSRTGSNIKIGIHDSGGTTTETTPNITSANVWQTVTIDLSAVTNANKDDIDSIIITIVNADAETTFYIDNFYVASLLTTSRYFTFADWQSGRALINTDIGLYTYTGTGAVSTVAAAPIGKFMTIWKKYVFMAGIRGSPNVMRYSDLSDYTTWTAAQTLNFDTNDGDVITGMRVLKGKLYVFKRYSVHRVSYLGSNPTFQVDPILGIGSPAHYTIKEVDMGGELGTVLVFLTSDKKLAIFDGYNVQVINDALTEKTNDLFATADDQPKSFSDMNLVYADLFHAVVKKDTYEYILYAVLDSDTSIGYAFVLDYKTGGIYPYDNQVFSSSAYVISTNKAKILYVAGYTGYMWQVESGNDDDGTDINAYWVSGKIKPELVSLAMKMLRVGINLKEITSASTINMNFQHRIDWNVSWTTAETFSFNHNDELAFGKTALFDIGTVENMFQIKLQDDSSNPAPTIYGIDLYGKKLGQDTGERATS